MTNRIEKTVRLLKVPITTIRAHLDTFDQHLMFIRKVPTMDVRLTLWQRRFKDRGRKADRNDWKDIGFLSVAIPYANIIVTENYWSHISVQTGLSTRYGSTVTTSLDRLPELLEAENCLAKPPAASKF